MRRALDLYLADSLPVKSLESCKSLREGLRRSLRCLRVRDIVSTGQLAQGEQYPRFFEMEVS